MSDARIPLARPSFGEDELALATSVLMSGQLTMGPALRRFEEAVRGACDTGYAVGCTNGTAALHLTLLALGVGPGDEVVVPAYTFPATANAAVHTGASVVFCDVEPGRDVSGPDQVAAALTERTKAVMLVHLFGCPADVAGVRAVTDAAGVALVEDAAGALGTSCDGRPAGSSGVAGCLSFHPRKAVTTGEGGAIVTNDAALAERLRALRHHGIHDGEFVDIGLNYRLSDVLAVLALPQLERLDDIVDARRWQAAIYDAALAELPGMDAACSGCTNMHEGDRHSYQAYVAHCDPELRDGLVRMLRERGVEAQVGTYCVPNLAPYRSRGYAPADTPNAVTAAASGIALPLFIGLRESEQEQVIETLGACLEQPDALRA